MLGRLSSSLVVASLAVSLFSWCSPVTAAIKPIGAVVAANGPFIAIQTDKSARSLTRGSEFYEGDRLWTGPRTKAQIRFSDGAIMTLRPDTEFSVDEYEFDAANAANNKSLFTLVKGGFRTLTGLITRLRPDSYKVKTTYAIVGVRGTTYETVIDSGLYVAAWQGTVSVGNEESELLLGFGQNFNYARVSSANSAPTGLLQTPPQLLETIDPALQEAVLNPTELRPTTGLLQDGVDARLTAAEVASLDRRGVAVSNSANVPPLLQGLSSDGSGGSPILFDVGADAVLRQGSAPASGVQAKVGGFDVSFGQWNASLSNPASLQTDATDASVSTAVTSDIFWITALPSAVPSAGTGTYSNVVAFQGAGERGPIQAFAVSATVDFGAATVGGTMQIQNGPLTGFRDNWDLSFSGGINGPSISANVTGGTVLVGGTPQPGTLNGSIVGTLTGPQTLVSAGTGPDAMAGAFDLRNTGTTNYVQGTFLTRQQ